MSMDIAMSLVTGVPSKGGERGGKGADAEASGFGEMLADKGGKTDRRMPKDARGTDGEVSPAQWRIGGYDARLAMAMPTLERLVAQEELPSPVETGAANETVVDADAMLAVKQAMDEEPATKTGEAAAAAGASAQRQKGDKERSADPAFVSADGSDTVDNEGEETKRPAVPQNRDAPVPTRSEAAVPSRQDAAATSPAQTRQAGATASAATVQSTPSSPSGDPATEAHQRPAVTNAQSDAARTTETRAQPSVQQTGDAAQPRVNVLGFTSSIAPAALNPAQMSPTSAGLVATMEAEPAWRAAAAEAAAATNSRSQAPATVSTLRIQLNPAELGMVTARLTATGTQLDVEIRVESNDARQRLANDSELILKALRSAGYDVEKVTIQQASPGTGAAPQQGNGNGRDAFLQGQQQAGENARGRNGQDGRDGERASGGNGRETGAENAGGGVYI